MSSLPKFRPAPLPNLCQFLDFNAAGPLTRPECGAGGGRTPSGAAGARESVRYVSRRSSWTPLLARLGGLLEVFSVMSTQLSAYNDSWILSLVLAICCLSENCRLCIMQPAFLVGVRRGR